MAMARRKSSKHNLSPDFQEKKREELVHSCPKTILFSKKELALIDQYCKKYSVRNRSAFFREIILTHIFQQLDDNYPKLF